MYDEAVLAFEQALSGEESPLQMPSRLEVLNFARILINHTFRRTVDSRQYFTFSERGFFDPLSLGDFAQKEGEVKVVTRTVQFCSPREARAIINTMAGRHNTATYEQRADRARKVWAERFKEDNHATQPVATTTGPKLEPTAVLPSAAVLLPVVTGHSSQQTSAQGAITTSIPEPRAHTVPSSPLGTPLAPQPRHTTSMNSLRTHALGQESYFQGPISHAYEGVVRNGAVSAPIV